MAARHDGSAVEAPAPVFHSYSVMSAIGPIAPHKQAFGPRAYGFGTIGLDKKPMRIPPPSNFAPLTPSALVVATYGYCSVHGKRRGMQNLESVCIGSAQLRCRAECICRVTGDAKSSSNVEVCKRHHKPRSRQWLQQHADGTWECRSGYECMSSDAERTRHAKADTNPPPAKVICTTHGKTRSVDAMRILGPASRPLYVCKRGQRCKGVKGHAMYQQLVAPYPPLVGPYAACTAHPVDINMKFAICALHAKKRSIRYLVKHPSVHGVHVCKPGFECL